jgi:hypothetical protein
MPGGGGPSQGQGQGLVEKVDISVHALGFKWAEIGQPGFIGAGGMVQSLAAQWKAMSEKSMPAMPTIVSQTVQVLRV